MSEITEIKTLNGYPLADTKARTDIATLSEEMDGLSKDVEDAKGMTVGLTIEGYSKGSIEMVDVKGEAEKTPGKFWLATDTAADSGQWSYYTLPVSGGERFRISTYTVSSGRAFYVYDDSMNRLMVYPTENVVVNGVGVVVDETVTMPTGAATLICNEETTFATLSLMKLVEKTDSMNFVRDKTYVDERNYLSGKKLVFCGDSITEALNPDGDFFTSYGEIVAMRNAMIVVKDGISGSTMANVEGHNPFCVSRYLNHTDFDYLTIWFGWNDGMHSTVGTIDDTEDTTFYGAYKKVLNHYVTTYPTKKIGVVVPYMPNYMENAEGIQKAVRDVSSMYGVPCLDLLDYNRCSLIRGEANDAQKARMNALTYDGTHPNQAGHEYISTMYENFLRSL